MYIIIVDGQNFLKFFLLATLIFNNNIYLHSASRIRNNYRSGIVGGGVGGGLYRRNFQLDKFQLDPNFSLTSPGYETSSSSSSSSASSYPNSQFYSEFLPDNRNLLTMLSNPLTSPMMSQNHRYMIKTPERDLHYATILKQQEQATIRHPFQAFQVAKDQAHMRGHMLRSSLQTSDDDVYEVESAPVMKATSPYQFSPFNTQFNNYRSSPASSMTNRYRLPSSYHHINSHHSFNHHPLSQPQHFFQPQESSQTPIELPSISMSFDPTPYHNNHHHHQQQQQQQHPHQQLPIEAYTTTSAATMFNTQPQILQRRWPQKRFSNWVDFNHENGKESRSKELTTSIRVAPAVDHSYQYQNNYHYQQQQPNYQYEMEPETKNLFMTIGIDQGNVDGGSGGGGSNDYQDSFETSASQQQQKIYNTQSDNQKNNQSKSILATAATTPAANHQHQQQRQQQKRTKNHHHEEQKQDNNVDPTSSWLDMGAYSATKGEFGWFTDTPVIVGSSHQNQPVSLLSTETKYLIKNE
ncbi:uncharacterized protein LOC124491739 [Dermatophagoides farinae]|uniref:uncharacterized protein LOC124491739 n=1 Tax=Dermatophagoides farinae TaxID=6954 RepID=UPI003F63328C